MCGIFGYTGKNSCAGVLIDGLKALEYRGYDSAGIYIPGKGTRKAIGQVDNLKMKVSEDFFGTSGIAHTRWATHGEPSEVNAHPHGDCSGRLWLVHNGIIENYKELKENLVSLGHEFISVTDSEVLVHLIEENLKNEDRLEKAVAKSLKDVQGTYGIAVLWDGEPDTVVAARMGSPIVLGIGENENFVSSDLAPLLRHTKNVIYLDDGEMAVLGSTGHRVVTLDLNQIVKESHEVKVDVVEAEKGGYEHFMLKEIMEEPAVVQAAIRGRLILEDGLVKLGGLESVQERLKDIERLVIVGCGTAYYAGLVGEYMMEEYAGIPVEVEIASEFRYRKPILDKKTAVLAISQSGETADTLAAIREAKRKGSLALGIVNTVGSTIARETDAGIYNHAGPEVGVASTKAFISQVSVLALLTIFLGRQRSMSLATGKRIGEEISRLPELIRNILDRREELEPIVQNYLGFKNFLYIGRKYNFSIAYEAALKLKEIAYVHAEGYGAGEMKHGPIAMIDETMPTIAVTLRDSVYEKMISNIEEIKARRGRVFSIATEGDCKIREVAHDVFYVPKTLEMLSPLLSIVPLQLFAYYFGIKKGYNVDRPRNLAKSVTVE